MSGETVGHHHRFWTTSILEVINPDHQRIAAPLRRLIVSLESQAPTAVESGVAVSIKHGLFETRFDLFTRPEPEIVELRGFCEAALDGALAALSPNGRKSVRYEINEAWAHVTRSGGYHDHHSHGDSFWCGIYYVDVGESSIQTHSGINRFYSPIPGYFDPASGEKRTSFDLTPVDGKLILFPGYLFHSALPYAGNRERFVVAFNTRLL
ncbi:MAG: hypothetical protein KDK91_01410 [Gammaproteobacteria bacterium]|nr:hypothetical protein [Gammaproteobacteria bacterium]